MSKVDAMRALREARFAQATPRPAAARRPPAAAAAPVPAGTAARAAEAGQAVAAAPSEAEAQPDLCGHRNIGGRSCTREADHQRNGTKSHRYG